MVSKNIIRDALVHVDKFISLVNFIVFKNESITDEFKQIPMILGGPFLVPLTLY